MLLARSPLIYTLGFVPHPPLRGGVANSERGAHSRVGRQPLPFEELSRARHQDRDLYPGSTPCGLGNGGRRSDPHRLDGRRRINHSDVRLLIRRRHNVRLRDENRTIPHC